MTKKLATAMKTHPGQTETDETIYNDMAGPITSEDVEAQQKIMAAWAKALDQLPPKYNNVRNIFLCCLASIETMGPAYCKLAIVNLMHIVKEKDEDLQ
jgi:hypothetical protein